MQTSSLNQQQGQQLCDEIAAMLLNTLESQDIDSKVEATINAFLAREKINANPAELTRKVSWSIKVRIEK